MKLFRGLPVFVALAIAASLFASDTKSNNGKDQLAASLEGRPPLTKQTRLELIRTMEAEFGFAKKVIPKGTKGLQLTTTGQITPDDQAIGMQVATNGPAARPGDKVQITQVLIKDRSIRFELNGGPKKKGHWYDHIEVGGAGGMSTVHQEKNINAKGSYLDLEFPKYVPEMTAADVKSLLSPVIDFSVKSPTQAYLDTLPPKIKAAIANHQALVGMSKDMVIDALGRPPKRVRERDGETDYEEWIYGEPPGDVQFVRFVNEEVVRVEHAQVGGERVIKTAREVKVNPATGQATVVDPNAPATATAGNAPAAPGEAPAPTQTAQAHKPQPPAKAPTMRRPGEQPEFNPGGGQAKDDGGLGSKPIPAPGQQEPEWGTKPASTGTANPSPSQTPDSTTANPAPQPPRQ